MEAYCMKCRAKREMKGRQGNHHEEWQAGDSGRLPELWHQDVPYRQGLR